jgi:hypothetical protein
LKQKEEEEEKLKSNWNNLRQEKKLIKTKYNYYIFASFDIIKQ